MFVIKLSSADVYIKEIGDYAYEATENINEAMKLSGWLASVLAKGISSDNEKWEVKTL